MIPESLIYLCETTAIKFLKCELKNAFKSSCKNYVLHND